MRPRRLVRAALATVVLFTTLYAGLLGTTGWKKSRSNTKIQEEYIYPVVIFNEEIYVSGQNVLADDASLRHAFNDVNSRKTAADRKIPDPRHPKCKEKKYSFSNRVKVSVIIAFHNEARSALLRTVTSVLNRTPPNILEEILLVDDQSEEFRDGFELTVLPKVKLLRNDERQGLIRSRDQGARMAKGSYLVFLDSHSEVNNVWLEPLLERVLKLPKSICSPVIDVIDSETFEYRPSSAQLKGGFDWGLHFKWLPLNVEERKKQKDQSQPFHSPIIPGGLFLIAKEWFLALGGFDTGLQIWGAENFEMSLKCWLCDGTVESVPCSRVGHVFRKRHPYTFPNGSATTYLRNTKRVVDVWFDEYKTFFYESRPSALEQDPGSLKERLELKTKLACKPFRWFLENIYPELRFPYSDAVAFGQLRQGEQCLDIVGQEKTLVVVTSCLLVKPTQDWSFTTEGELLCSGRCLTSKGKDGITLENCKKQKNQKWSRRRRRVVNVNTGLCLEIESDRVKLSDCEHYAFSQQWDFTMELQSFDSSRSR